MQHPVAIAVAATSSSVLAAAVRVANPALVFLAIGFLCFALAVIVRDDHVAPWMRPASWIAVGAIQVAAFLSFRHVHPVEDAPSALAIFGITYLILGTASLGGIRSS